MRGFEQQQAGSLFAAKAARERRAKKLRRLEWLEERHLLSATALVDGPSPAAAAAPNAPAQVITASLDVATDFTANAALVTNAGPAGLSPTQIKTAYSFPPATTGSSDGSGQTIAVVDAYNDPNIISDLSAFDAKEGVTGSGTLTVMNQNGATINPAVSSSNVPPTNSGWDLEIALDVEWAHAIAPGANIVLVEANSASLADLMAAVNTARDLQNVSVVSMSWGEAENLSNEIQYDPDFTTPAGHMGVTFVAASGDDGSPALWPATSGNVLAVGGTTLTTTNASGTYGSETAWSDSGGGTSNYEIEPSYQSALQSTGRRTAPDVSYDANPSTGFAVYDSVPADGASGWQQVGGTSDAAPQWSAIVAIADQDRVADGSTPLSQGQAAIDNLPQADFHDITTGSNGGYSATKGYDEVTGLGTPVASSVIRDLTASTVSYTPPAVTTTSGSTGSGHTGNGGSGGGGNGSNGHHHENDRPGSGPGGFSGSFGFGFLVETNTGPESSATSTASGPASAFAAGQTTGQSGTLALNPLTNGLVIINGTANPAGGSSAAAVNSLLADSSSAAFPARSLSGGLAAPANELASDLSPAAERNSASAGLPNGFAVASNPPVFAPLTFHYQSSSTTTAGHNGPVFRYTSTDAVDSLPEGDDAARDGHGALTAALWEALAPTLDFSPGAILDEAPLLADTAAPAVDGALELATPVALILAGLAAGWAHSTADGRGAMAAQKRMAQWLATRRDRRAR